MPKDFSHQDLRSKSFKGQDLTGADFSHADIRGVSFKGAILKGANFANAKGGVTKKSFVLYLLMILVLSVLAGLIVTICNVWIVFIVDDILKEFKANTNANIVIYTLLYSIVYVSALFILIRKGKYNFWGISLIGAFALSFALAAAFAGSASLTGFKVLAAAGSLIVAGSVAGFVAIVAGSVAGFVVIIAGDVAGFVVIIAEDVAGSVSGNLTIAIAVAILIQFLLSVYVAYRANKEDEQFETYRKFGLTLSSLLGTSFDGANLTETNFSKANLKYCRFSKETITIRTCFKNAENLKFARLTGTILENKAVRELLVSGIGKGQSFRELNLKGAYFVGADLSGADFHEADFIGATLENANLKDANLSRIQALGVEFRGADFTGACLESWNIDSTTQLEGANADYVYLLNNKLERRPASGHFGQGEFAKLFNEVLDTVDFIFRNGIDWQAFMVSFDNLREKVRVESEDADISIQSITNKGDGVFVVKVSVPPHTDKPEFHSSLTKEYEMNLKLIEEKYQAKLEAKEEVIRHSRETNIDLKEIIRYQSERTIQNIIYNEPKAEASMGNHTFSAGNVSNAVINVGDGNTVNQNSTVAAPSPDEAKLRELLIRLEKAIEKSEGITPESKEDALEEVKEIAKAGKNPKEEENRKRTRKAITFFNGFIKSLPKATETIGEIMTLSAAIGKLFGL